MRRSAARNEILTNPAYRELLGGIAGLSKLSGRMTARLEGIRRDFLDLWELWQQA